MPEDQETEFNKIVQTQQEEREHESKDDMDKIMESIAIAAEQTMPHNLWN